VSVPTAGLARWASDPAISRGRRIAEPPSPPRHDHQRDRDRIVHCTAFRRLVYKTQVFLNHEGDLFRTRLTHSLEVAQIARSAARALALNEDLCEAIALAHDLGHTPFGHAGQDALHQAMRGHGGFEHNLQSLRVVDLLERRYAAFDGLNLSFETREGILKHCSRRAAQALLAGEPGHPALRFLERTQPGPEAQLVNLADEIAYVTHDLDDGVRSGLLELEELLEELPLVERHAGSAAAQHPALREQPRRWLAETLRRMLSTLIHDLVAESGRRLAEAEPRDADAVRRHADPLLASTAAIRRDIDTLRRWLFARLYRHPQVVARTALGQRVVAELFAAYAADPTQMPEEHRAACAEHGTPRAVADYVSGMTDRFALREHHRLTGLRLFPEAG
jgi:dGTPase